VALYSDPLSAHNHFAAQLKNNPDDAYAHHGLALLFQREKKYPQAAAEFKKTLALDREYPAVLADLGAMYFEMKDLGAARQVLERAKSLEPRSVRTLFLLGRTYEEMGDLKQAKTMYERTLVQDPNHEEALYKMGLIYEREGDLARAHLHTGLYFLARGDEKNALYHFRKAKENYGSASLEVKERVDAKIKELSLEKGHKPPAGPRFNLHSSGLPGAE
ncbi:MAG: tetratricopeptide repeat protein, partial [Thermodesulfobacteriota bacterium]